LSFSRRSNWALRATTIVEADIREACENPVGNRSVVVGVIPVDAGRMIERKPVLVSEAGAGIDRDEHVVPGTLRGDMQPVHVQVCGLVKAVDKPDAEYIARTYAESGTRDAAVVTHSRGLPPGEPELAWAGFEPDLQPPAGARTAGTVRLRSPGPSGMMSGKPATTIALLRRLLCRPPRDRSGAVRCGG
jgi:hypothetical protein